jgi:hypothetical protein
MSRRSRNGRKTDKFGCLYRPQWEAIENGVSILRDRYVQVLTNDFTVQDVMNIYVHPDKQEDARRVYKEYDARNPSHFHFVSPGPSVPVNLHGRFLWAQPRDFKPGAPSYINQNCEPYQRMTRWCHSRRDIGIQWGTAMAVFYDLAHRCTNIHELRYFWPCVRSLLREGGDLETAAKLEKPRHVPDYTLSKLLRDCAYEAQTLVTSTLMMPAPARATPPVTLDIVHIYDTPTLPWAPDQRARDSGGTILVKVPAL